MGSYNGSCFFSGLSIRWNEPAVIFPVLVNGNTVLPALFPIYGTYNDYGSLDKIVKTPFNQRIFELFVKYIEDPNGPSAKDKALLKKKNDELNKIFKDAENFTFKKDSKIDHESLSSRIVELFREIASLSKTYIRKSQRFQYALNTPKITTIEDMVQVMERRDASKVLISSSEFNISFVMIHGEVWESVKNAILNDTEFRTFDPTAEYSYADCTGEVSIEKTLDNLTKGSQGFDAFTEFETDAQMYHGIHKHVFHSGYADSLKHYQIFKDEELYTDFIKLNGELEPSLRSVFKDYLIFQYALTFGRKVLHLSAMGGQSDNYEYYQKISETVNNICTRNIEKQKLQDAEDEED